MIWTKRRIKTENSARILKQVLIHADWKTIAWRFLNSRWQMRAVTNARLFIYTFSSGQMEKLGMIFLNCHNDFTQLHSHKITGSIIRLQCAMFVYPKMSALAVFSPSHEQLFHPVCQHMYEKMIFARCTSWRHYLQSCWLRHDQSFFFLMTEGHKYWRYSLFWCVCALFY